MPADFFPPQDLAAFMFYLQASHGMLVRVSRSVPGLAQAVLSPFAGSRAVTDVVAVVSDQLLTRLRRLLLFSKLIVLPATLVLPQLSVSPLRPETKNGKRSNS